LPISNYPVICACFFTILVNPFAAFCYDQLKLPDFLGHYSFIIYNIRQNQYFIYQKI